jgi:uncharacterized protein involved in exopolysaccharide biosynthesis
VSGSILKIGRRRYLWILTALLLSAAATGYYAQQAQQEFRVSATLSVDVPVAADVRPDFDIDAFADEAIATRHVQAVSELDIAQIIETYDGDRSFNRLITPAVRIAQLRDRATASRIDASFVDGIAGEPSLVSTIFIISVTDTNQRVASTMLEALLELHTEDRVEEATRDINQQLLEIDADLVRQAAEIDDLENTIASLRVENADALGNSTEAGAREASMAQSELIQIDAQIQTLQANSVTVSDALRGLDPRGGLRRSAADVGTISPERLIALQTLVAIERGSGGASSSVEDLVREEQFVRSALEQDASSRLNELATAQTEYERLQTLYPLDHPDVVRAANTVSGLENASENIDAIGLTIGEIRNIESLAREEQQLLVELDQLRAQRDEARALSSEIQARLARTPILLDQIEQLTLDVSDAEDRYTAMVDERAALADEYGMIVRRSEPPAILSEPPYLPEVASASRSSTIAGVGALLGMLLALILVLVVEKLDKRIDGAQSIAALCGKLPIGEIPIIASPARARGS